MLICPDGVIDVSVCSFLKIPVKCLLVSVICVSWYVFLRVISVKQLLFQRLVSLSVGCPSFVWGPRSRSNVKHSYDFITFVLPRVLRPVLTWSIDLVSFGSLFLLGISVKRLLTQWSGYGIVWLPERGPTHQDLGQNGGCFSTFLLRLFFLQIQVKCFFLFHRSYMGWYGSFSSRDHSQAHVWLNDCVSLFAGCPSFACASLVRYWVCSFFSWLQSSISLTHWSRFVSVGCPILVRRRQDFGQLH